MEAECRIEGTGLLTTYGFFCSGDAFLSGDGFLVLGSMNFSLLPPFVAGEVFFFS